MKYQQALKDIKALLAEHKEGLSIHDIAEHIKANRNAVAKYVDVLQISGYVDLRSVGPAKLFYLTHRVPTCALLDSTNEIILVIDEKGIIIQANQMAQKIFKRKALVGLALAEVFPEIMPNIDDRKQRKFMIPFRRWVLAVTAIPSTLEDGSAGITLIAEDRTEDAKIQERLAMLQRAVEASSSGIAIAEAGGDMPLIYVNPAFTKLTGYASSEILGKNCRFLQGRDRDQPGLDRVRKALRNGEECVAELRNYRKDGTMFWNELRIAPVKNEKGDITHFVGLQTDITHKK